MRPGSLGTASPLFPLQEASVSLPDRDHRTGLGDAGRLGRILPCPPFRGAAPPLNG